MKKAIVIMSLVSLFVYTPVFGQVNFGVKAGGNLQTLAGLGDLWLNPLRGGSHIGVFTEFEMSPSWSLQAELNYQEKGSKMDGAELLGLDELAVENHYLSLPVLSKYYFAGKGATRLYILNGPELSYLMASQRIEDSGEKSVVSNNDSELYKTDLSLVFGAGLQVPFRSNCVFADVRYDMGLLQVDKSDKHLRNKVMELSLGLRF